MISYYPPQEGAVITYEHSSQAKNPVVDPLDAGLGVPGRCSNREDALPVTPEEEEAWGEKLQRLAGCVA